MSGILRRLAQIVVLLAIAAVALFYPASVLGSHRIVGNGEYAQHGCPLGQTWILPNGAKTCTYPHAQTPSGVRSDKGPGN